MDAGRWKQVKDVFDAALGTTDSARKEFLDSRCAGDEDLRREVETLLEAHTGAGAFLDRPATPIPRGPGSLVGQSISRYKVSKLIGEGGMGAVYLAFDEELKRNVAIKTLHSSMAWDAELIQRLEREARAESAINHPNICTVYDFGEINGVPYIVMEYLEGEPLRTRISAGRPTVEQIADIGAHVASALAAAHAKGIIHRDVKPGNIFLTRDGQIKIMDFGVAKNIGGRKGLETTNPLTSPWVRIGTVAYMSPEQAAGEPVDGRSDIFSLGSVLYEMAAGRPPFSGSGPLAIMNSILNDAPVRPSEINRSVPPALERLILRALEKDRTLRYQTAGDMAADLRRLLKDSSSGTIPAAVPAKAGRRWWIAAAAAGVCAVGVALWMGSGAHQPSAQPLKITSLGSLRGIRENPVIDSDGGRIAFSWTGADPHSGQKQIYVQLVGAGKAVQLTQGPGLAESPVWSPNGQEIAYLRVEGGKSAYYTVSALGGNPTPLLPALDPPPRAGGTALDWSPDGRSLVVADRSDEDSPRTLTVIDRATGARRAVGEKSQFICNPAFSPDGRLIAYTTGSGFLSHDIWVVPAAGGRPTRLTHDGKRIAGLTWTADGKRIIFSSRKVGPFRLWSVPASGGAVEPVPQTDTDVLAPHIGRRSKRLVYARTKLTRNLYRETRRGGQAGELIVSNRESFQPVYSPDGTRLAFASDRTGSYEIFVTGADGKDPPMQLTTFGGAHTGSPSWSPDGQWIAFDSRAEGNSDIYVVQSLGGGTPRRLTEDASEDRSPVWSPDGKSLYFVSNRTGRNQIWRMAAEGSKPAQVTSDGGTYAAEDPQTGTLFYTNSKGLWKRSNFGAGSPESITPEFPLLSWMYWRGAVHYARAGSKGVWEIISLGVAGGQSGVLPVNGSRSSDYMTFTISPDGEWVVFDRVDKVENEILLVENF